jgi:hypothetical protein
VAINFKKSKKCLLFPFVPNWVFSTIFRSNSLQKLGGLWNFIKNNKNIRHARRNFPKCESMKTEIEELTQIDGCSDTAEDECDCIEIDCSESSALRRMGVCYQNWAGGDVKLCVQYHDQSNDDCFLYSNVALTRILQIVQSKSKGAQIQYITEDPMTIVAKLPNFPRCTDTPVTVGRSSPMHSDSFNPILE